jgi:hypothetical protein
MRILRAKERAAPAARVEPVQEEPVQPAEDLQQKMENGSGIAGALANHKGKLAVGAAAMLGLAVFYKWRESKLARDDPEEYARLRRLKAAVDTDNG